MWNFLLGLLFARATGISRVVRPLLALVLIGAVVAGIFYAVAVFNAVQGRSQHHYVPHNPTR